MSATLEQRIATALSSETTSDVVAILIAEVETAIVAADKAAQMEREKALDPLASPDAAKARAAMEDAGFTRDRLRNVLPRLQARLTELQAAEYAARWEPDFEQVEGRRNELAQGYAELYPKLAGQLVDLFERIEAVDKEVSRVNGLAPEGEHRRLRQTELVARGLDNFSRADPPITKAVQLPDWTNSEKMVWPPPQPSLAAVLAMSMVPSHDPRYTADWAAALEKDNARRAATETRWAEEEAARQAESRAGYEASLRR
jgi:hypothetical protein